MSDTTTKATENVVNCRRASDWQKPDTLTEHPDGSATLSDERKMVCLEAVWELEALAGILPGLIPDHEPFHLTVRGIAGRIRSLSEVVISGLSDELTTLVQLERNVFGAAQREAA